MVEIAKRKMVLDEAFSMYECFQVSLNSWGHITLRWFNREKVTQDQTKQVDKELHVKRETDDLIIVLSENETNELLRFLRKLLVKDI